MLQWAATGPSGNSGQISRTLSHPHGVRVQRLGVAAGAGGGDGARRPVLDERFGDLRAGAVAGAQEQQSRASASWLGDIRRRRRDGKTGVQRVPGVAEEVAAAQQIGAVVDVAAVGRAAARGDDAGLAELLQVVGDQVLRLADELDELADAPIAAPELVDQLPAQRIAEQPEDRGWRCRLHEDITTHCIDAMQVDVLWVSCR
jgi:hypothetical protein